MLKQHPNRIGHDDNSALRYDAPGNRTEQQTQYPDGRCSRHLLYYDGGNQLTVTQVDVMGQKDVPPHLFGAARYINDALGRRLKKTVQDNQGQMHPTYFGWDGDRLVHTESLWGEGQSLERDIVHVVYEPGAFTPMLRLSATIKGAWKAQPYFMVQAAIAGLPQHKKNDDDVWGNLQAMQNALERMAPNISKQLDANMRRIVREEPAENMLTGMGQHLDGIMTVGDVRKALQEQQRQANITVLYFHCDHIGTPLALLDQRKKIVWAARRDPWGNLQEQYNPSGIIQPIGLPGQHYDRETGLYYNGHRYYDARIGCYINQDPIGLAGGWNTYVYADVEPITHKDPRGLSTSCSGNWVRAGWDQAPTIAAGLVGIARSLTGTTVGGKSVSGETIEQGDLGPSACRCYWLCYPCNASIVWSGNPNDSSLPQTEGKTFFSGDGDISSANECLCPKPGPETKCPSLTCKR